MKKSMIIGKRQMILAALVMALGVAVYLNWQFAAPDGGLGVNAGVTSGRNLGDAQFVNNPVLSEERPAESEPDVANITGAAGIEGARQSRDDARVRALEKLRDITDDARSDPAIATQAAEDTARIIRDIETEGLLEGLIKARGFSDAAVIISGDNVNVIVAAEGLEAAQTLTIQELVMSQAGASIENITIHEAS